MTEAGLFSLTHLPSGRAVATVRRADGWWAQGWGVIGWPDLPLGQGLWLPGVASVHTVFVRFPLDLLFLDSHFATVRVVPNVPPGRLLVRAPGAKHTVELGAGTLAGLAVKTQDLWALHGTKDRR